jgi:hypothetical protein
MSSEDSLPDGAVPFMDQRLPRDAVELLPVPAELAAFIELEIEACGITIPDDEPMELRFAAPELATMAFMLQRAPDGTLLALMPPGALRRPS